MTNDEAEVLRKKAMRWAKRYGFDRQSAQDLAHDAIVIYLEYKLRNSQQSAQSVRQAVVDAIRRRLGRISDPVIEVQLHEVHGARTVSKNIIDTSVLTRRELTLYNLHIVQGHHLKDAGAQMRVTESRASQMYKEIKRKLKEANYDNH